MIKIGILGDIGSGKSYIAKKFGYPIFNADYEVNKIYKKNKKCFKKLKKKFPNYNLSFPIKKKELSKLIKKNIKNIKKINEIIHPEVRLRLKKFIKKNSKKKFVVLDIPLLLEGKINSKKDILIFIQTKNREVDKRLKNRSNFNYFIFKKLKKLQLPLEFKKKKSHFIIKNNFKNEYVKKNVKKIVKKILLNA